jgi:DNA-directed RNA polymerase sigma subunit (sigma70/sigma32)
LLAEVPMTLQAIADAYGVTRERARQIEERIKQKLKLFFEQEGVKVEDHIG